jgi:hypothetical protein
MRPPWTRRDPRGRRDPAADCSLLRQRWLADWLHFEPQRSGPLEPLARWAVAHAGAWAFKASPTMTVASALAVTVPALLLLPLMLLLQGPPAQALDNGLALTPPMGWRCVNRSRATSRLRPGPAQPSAAQGCFVVRVCLPLRVFA